MPSCHDLVLQNFGYRICAISPTSTLCRKLFRLNARPDTVDATTSAGMVRTFEVYFDESGPTHDVEDIVERAAESSWVVKVAYPVDSARGFEELQRLILQDRHDLIKALRSTDGYVGVSATATTTTIGLYRREWLGDEIDRDGEQTWYYLQRWGCTIFESE